MDYVTCRGKVLKRIDDAFLWRFRHGGTLIDRWISLSLVEDASEVKHGDTTVRLASGYALLNGMT